MHQLTRLFVYCRGLRRPLPFPGPDRFANYLIHRLGEGLTRLVYGNIKIADSGSRIR
jgi:hypothetical protein